VGDPDRDHGRLWEPSRDNRRRAHHRDLPDGHRHRLRRRADRRRSRALRPQSEGGGGTRASRAPRDPWDAWTTSPPGSMRSNGDNPGPHRAARWRGPWAGWATRPFPEMLRAQYGSETDLGSRQRFGRRGGASGRLRPLGNPKRSASLAQMAWRFLSDTGMPVGPQESGNMAFQLRPTPWKASP
jgi:hypothetical protein